MSKNDPRFILYQVIENNYPLIYIKWLLRCEVQVNDPIVTRGPYAGFTALHLACLRGKFELVKMLIEVCKASVHVTANDGTQPLHLACFSVNRSFAHLMVRFLLKAGANVDAEFGEEIFLKYFYDSRNKWSSDFGEKITLLTYAFINKQANLARDLLMHGANYRIKTHLTNKTLLMVAIEKNYFAVALEVLKLKWRDPEFVNARDNENMTAISYILHPKKYGEYRYYADQIKLANNSYNIIIEVIIRLIDWGADINVLMNGDPEMSLINIAAYRSCQLMLRIMLPFLSSSNHNKVLYYATLPIDEDFDRYYVRVPENNSYRANQTRCALRSERKKCLKLILINLVIRQTFGIPGSKEEIILMEKLIATDREVRNFVEKFKLDIIDGILKKQVIEICGENINLDDFITQVYDNKKLKKLLQKDCNLGYTWSSHIEKYILYCFGYYLKVSISKRINEFSNRIQLLEMLKTVSNLRQHIPLPYECVLDIIEYVNNDQLNMFIQAFNPSVAALFCLSSLVASREIAGEMLPLLEYPEFYDLVKFDIHYLMNKNIHD